MKPEYRVPSMAEIAAVEKNGFSVMSTFAGCGGSSLGYRMAGFIVLWANEFVSAAREVYIANASRGTIVDGRDIRAVDPAEVLRSLKMKPGDLDVLDGSPPCASFSMAGKRAADWGATKKYCVAPETPVLLTDMTWRPAGSLVEGDQVVAFDEETGGRHRKFRPAAVLESRRLLQPCVRITTSDGATVVCSADHRWLFVQGRNLRWRQSKRLRKGDQLLSIGRPWKADETYDGGYLSGIFDGEGCVSKQKNGGTRLLGFAQRPGAVLDRAVDILKRTGAPFGIYPASVSDTLTVNINGGPFSKARILGIFRPLRLLPKAGLLWDGVNIGASEKVEVTSVEFLGEREVVALSTSAKTFIADGLLSHNSDTTQRTDDLFFEFIRFVKVMQPKVFVAENVSGLVKGVAKGYFLQILAAMKACGYRVEAKLLDAQWLGVPQARQRIIFVGVREDLGVAPAHPEPLPYRYSVRDAIPKLSSAMIGANGGFGKETWQSVNEPAKTIGTSPKTGNGRVGAGDVVEDMERRMFSIDELKRICAFPSDFILTGSDAEKWERLGRAVPPVMMRAIAEKVRTILTPPASLPGRRARRRSLRTSG